MKTLMCAVIVFMLLMSAAFAVDSPTPKINLSAQDMPLKDAVDLIGKQAGVNIVLDPKAQCKVTASLTGADLSQTLDVLTKPNNLTWKKLQFAKPSEDKVPLEQLKAAVVTLATVQVVGISVEDPSAKTASVFAKDLPASPDTSAIKLPDGYSWTTVYVVLAPPEQVATEPQSDVKALSQEESQRMLELANLTPEERQQVFAQQWVAQMSLQPEVRRAIMQDQMRAMFNMDPSYRDQFREDMRAIFQSMHDQGQTDGRQWPRGGGGDHQD